jgi:DNA invertase Pin-like site-specific DNA recombinase
MKNKKSFLVYFDWYEPLSVLSDSQLGEITRAMFSYAKNQTEPEFSDPSLKMVFGFMKSAFDRDREAYKERCKKNAENANKGEKKKSEIQKKTVSEYDLGKIDTYTLCEELRQRKV